MKAFFLSYARADEGVALRLADRLIAAGVPIWVDQYDISPSQHWDRAVEAAVRGCEGMIVVLSPKAAASHNVADEVSVAIESGKQVIPILIEACTVPLRMTRMQFIDATRDLEAGVACCLRFIQGGPAGPPADRPPPPAAPPGVPAWPDGVLAAAEQRLTTLIGPIAPRLVRAAAGRARSEAELYRILAESLTSPRERDSFMAAAPSDPAPAAALPAGEGDRFDAGELAEIASALTLHLGPISPRLVDREAASATSRQDLRLRLAARIANEAERAAFLKRIGAG